MENPNILAPAYVVLGIIIIGSFVLILPLITVIVMKFLSYAYKPTWSQRKKVNTTLADTYCNSPHKREALYEQNHPINTIPIEELQKYLSDSKYEVLAKTLK